MSLIVLGSIGIDTVQTPDGVKKEEILGGSCTYFSAAASFYGPVRLVAAVGEDFPEEFRGVLSSFDGIDLEGLETRAGSKTFRWGGKYLDDMDHRETLFTELGVLGEAPPPVPESFKDSRFVFLANAHPATQKAMLEAIPSPTLSVADTMDLWIDTAHDDLRALMGKIDGLVLNYDEAEQFTGKRNPVTAGRHLLDMGPRFVVIKKGEHGAILVHKDGIGALPAFPTEDVVDPTGAGDSFAGGMMGSLASSNAADPGSYEAVLSALGHGTIIASFNVEQFSLGRLKELSKSEIDDRYAAFAKMVRLS